MVQSGSNSWEVIKQAQGATSSEWTLVRTKQCRPQFKFLWWSLNTASYELLCKSSPQAENKFAVWFQLHTVMFLDDAEINKWFVLLFRHSFTNTLLTMQEKYYCEPALPE